MLFYFHTYPRLSLLIAKFHWFFTHSFVTNINIFSYAATARPVFFHCCTSVVPFSFTTFERSHAIGLFDFVQEKVGSHCKSKSCSSLIKDTSIFLRHVTLLNKTAPMANTRPRSTLETICEAPFRGNSWVIGVSPQNPLETTWEAPFRGNSRVIGVTR